ncbi:TPA: hypothetical protein KKK63_003675 [Escherichia coli]|nr:hypothetical protein [Escherichia coli]
MFAGKKSAQIREILISESTWEEMTCLFAPSLVLRKGDIEIPSDLAGVLYTELDEHGGWKRKLLSELAYAGVPFDKDKALSA